MKDTLLRNYQKEAVEAVLEAIKNDRNRISLEMAPGTGKTIVMAALVEQLLDRNTKILLVTNRQHEVERIRGFLSEQLTPKIEQSIISSNVLISLYPRLRMQKDKLPIDTFSFVILLDYMEGGVVLNFLSDINTTIIGFLSGKNSLNSMVLFDIADPADRLFTNEDCVYRFSHSEAVQQGYLSPMVDPAMYEPATIGFCQRLFTKHGCSVLNQDSLHWHYGERIDLAVSVDDRRILIECKVGRYEYLSPRALNFALSRIAKMKDADSGNDISMLVIIGKVTEQEKKVAYDQYGILVWDVANLLYYVQHDDQLYEELSQLSYFPLSGIAAICPVGWIPFKPTDEYSPRYIIERASFLKKQLEACKTGQEHATEYENLCNRIIEFLFSSAFYVMSDQHKTKDEHFRMDLICSLRGESEATHPFWKMLPRYYNSHFVVFEYKNYEKPIEQNLIYITEKYLFNAALRNVAIIISRQGFSRSAQFAADGTLKENGKLIMSLTDSDLIKMLDCKAKGDSPVDVLLNLLEDSLMGISK